MEGPAGFDQSDLPGFILIEILDNASESMGGDRHRCLVYITVTQAHNKTANNRRLLKEALQARRDVRGSRCE
ncbi:MAG: hypothetical protein ABS54_02355 [Hyphomicrobium sp. SCN 65-11]|nr:MAG: hypothetical protein ABS54_02355 [Hyphomicrobium sp. SCN 65-11]